MVFFHDAVMNKIFNRCA